MQSDGMRLQKRSGHGGSLRSLATAHIASHTVRPLADVLPANRAGVLVARRTVSSSRAVLGPALRGSHVVAVRRGTVRGEWVRGPCAEREDAVILYLHGSGYVICSSRTHRGITTRLSAKSGFPVFACDYRLAPSHAFPAAADDVRAAYDWLLGEGHDPARIVVAGDSAGGHLAVGLALELTREGRTPPTALALLSPLVDPTMRLALSRERMQSDPFVSSSAATRFPNLYLGEHPPRRLPHSFEGAAGFPPTLVQAGSREMLAADAGHLTRSLEAAGVSCALEIWPGQMHVFQALSRVVPEADRALGRAAGFVVEQLSIAERRSPLTLVRGA